MASRSLINKTGHTIYVGKLPWTTGSQQLFKYFSQFGDVTWAKVFFDTKTGFSKHFGFVSYSSENSCNQVLHMTHYLEGNQLETAPSHKISSHTNTIQQEQF